MKKKLLFLIIGIVALAGVIIALVFIFKPAQVPRDDEGYNAAISEVCAFYRVQIVNYDTGINTYKLSVDPSTWDSNDNISRTNFCRNCQKAFDKMMHKYGITPESESVDLTVYKGSTLVATVTDGKIDTSYNAVNEYVDDFTSGLSEAADAWVEDYTEAYEKIVDGVMDAYNDAMKKYGF